MRSIETRTPCLSIFAVLAAFIAASSQAQFPPPDNLNPSLGGDYPYAYALAVQPDGGVLVGGGFTTLSGNPHNRIGRLSPDGTEDRTFQPSAGGSFPFVLALGVQPDGRILLGGQFTTLNSAQCNRIARLNPDGTRDTAFSSSADSTVYCLLVQDDRKILVGGSFTTLGGQPRPYLARLNSDGTVEGGFNPQLNDSAYSVAVQADGQIVVGGHFTTLGGQTHLRLGRVDSSGSPDNAFNPSPNSDVLAVVVQPDGKILVGGKFTTVNSQPRNRLARLNADGTLDGAFNPGANADVTTLLLQADGRLVVGGQFTSLGGQTRSDLARLNADGTLDSSFNCGVNFNAIGLAGQADGKVLVGGDFTSLGGQPRRGLGRLTRAEPATESLSYDGNKILWLRGGTSPEIWSASFDSSTDGISWTYAGAGQRINGGWQLTNAALRPGATIRARGWLTGAFHNGSCWFIESKLAVVPVIITDDGNFGLISNQFGFNFRALPGQVIVVECSTNPIGPVWKPVGTNTFSGSPCYFCDPQWSQSPSRFYRLRAP